MLSLFARYKNLVITAATGCFVGGVGGVISIAFLQSLRVVNEYRVDNSWVLYLLPVAGLFIGLSYHFLGASVSQGSNLVLEEIHEPGAGVPRRMAPMVFLGTTISQLFGASTGREGAGIQIVSSVTDAIARLFSPTYETRKVLLITSIAAALGGLFAVPVAGVVFALEVQERGRIRYEAILPASVASLISFRIVEAAKLERPIRSAIPDVTMNWTLGWKIAVLGIVCALLATSFIQLTHFIQHITKQFVSWPPLRPVVGSVVILLLVLVSGTRDYLGLSVELSEKAYVGAASVVAVAFLWKMVFTSVSLGTGFVGGEMVPIFIIGALAGGQVGHVLGESMPLFAAVGMVAMFAAASNTPIACVFIGLELFGGATVIPIALGCVVAYVVSGEHSVYHSQRNTTRLH